MPIRNTFDAIAKSLESTNSLVFNESQGVVEPPPSQNLTENDLNILLLDNGTANVVDEYNWTVSTTPEARNECPRIYLKEFQQTNSAVKQAIEFLGSRAVDYGAEFLIGGGALGPIFSALLPKKNVPTPVGNQTSDPYTGLYLALPTGNNYIFPYYSQYDHDTANQWTRSTFDAQFKGVSLYGTLERLAELQSPNAGTEKAQYWEGTTTNTYPLVFQLLNTVDPEQDIPRNKRLKDTLIYNNLSDRRGVQMLRPPVLYTVTIPGIRYSPVAVISNLNVSNKGQMNFINGMNVPDAWEFTINITELITETRQVFAGIRGGTVITAIKASSLDTLGQNIKKAIGLGR